MDCPKCDANMKERTVNTLRGKITIDQCEDCRGMWFDPGEAVALKGEWMSEYLDDGEAELGKELNVKRDINCPHCGTAMQHMNDKKQSHIQFEACPDHGVFLDAGEFTDYKNETIMDLFRGIAAKIGRS